MLLMRHFSGPAGVVLNEYTLVLATLEAPGSHCCRASPWRAAYRSSTLLWACGLGIPKSLSSQQNTHPKFHQKCWGLGSPQALPPHVLLPGSLKCWYARTGSGPLEGDRQVSWWVLWVCPCDCVLLTVNLSLSVSVSVHYVKSVLRGQNTLSSGAHSLPLLETLRPSSCRLAECRTLSVEMEQLPGALEGEGILCRSPCLTLRHMS